MDTPRFIAVVGCQLFNPANISSILRSAPTRRLSLVDREFRAVGGHPRWSLGVGNHGQTLQAAKQTLSMIQAPYEQLNRHRQACDG